MRVYALYAFVAALVVYAWRDWFKSLCGLILLMAVIEHEDMPKNIMGIQGLNPWNILLVAVVVAWLVGRRKEKLAWDMPRHVNVMLLLYLAVILIGFARAAGDMGHLTGYSMQHMISDQLVNTIKWVIPGLLLFDGCRDRRRLVMGLLSILGASVLLAAQVIRKVPPGAVFDRGGMEAARYIVADTGYSACDVSTLLAGVSWGILAMLLLCRRRWQKVLAIAAAAVVAYGQALTGGRAGYVAWGVIGLTLCLLRWRKGLLLAPFVVAGMYLAFPGAVDRLFTGFGQTDVAGHQTADDRLVTSSRSLAWPFVIRKIEASPVVGYGQLATQRTGLTDRLDAELGGKMGFTHPHNAYLEWLLDNGILGSVPVAIFFGVVLIGSARLFRDRRDPWCGAVGGMALAYVLAQLVAGVGSQHFYPEESTLAMWAVVFLMFRLSVERARMRAPAAPATPRLELSSRSPMGAG